MTDLDENRDGEVDFQEFVLLVAALTVACNEFFVESMKEWVLKAAVMWLFYHLFPFYWIRRPANLYTIKLRCHFLWFWQFQIFMGHI